MLVTLRVSKFQRRMVSTGDTEISSTYDLPDSGTTGGGVELRSQNWKYSKCQDMPKFQIFGLGGGGLSGLKFQRGALWRMWTQIYCLRLVYRTCLCITDSLSHPTYVETNKYLNIKLYLVKETLYGCSSEISHTVD